MTASRFVLWLLISGAVILGFGIALAAAQIVAILVPHCGIPCDDSGPEFVAAAAGYGTWFLTAAAISTIAWRGISRR